jgi:fatty-acid desaturase
MATVPLPIIEITALAAVDYAAPVAGNGPLTLPAGVKPFQLNWPYILAIAGYHVVALLAFMPGYFSWSGLILAALGTHLCGLFGINLCYHRLLTHRGLKCPKCWSTPW